MADGPTSDDAERSLTALLAEHEFVSGLIPFYRGVEIRALSALGVTVGAITTVFVALADRPDANVAALAGILSLTAWLFVLFVSIEVTASLRIKRASSYISQYLYPRIGSLAPSAGLAWESTKSVDLIGVDEDRRWSHQRNQLRGRLVTSGPLSLGIGLAGLVVGGLGIWVLTSSDTSSLNSALVWIYGILAGVGGLLSGLLGLYGYNLTSTVERNR